MKSILLLHFFLLSTIFFSQEKKVITEIKSANVFELSIIKVYPDSFPNVSVLFQAKNNLGKPLWLLKKEELIIRENDKQCEILNLINITENKPLNIGLVLDHSGSMFENPSYSADEINDYLNAVNNDKPAPFEYTTSLDFAKLGINQFIDKIDNSSDSILFVGFSETVDNVFPLTNNLESIKLFIKDIQPDKSTAFYDALYLSLDSLSKHASKSAIIALTDGQDNSSIHTLYDVINKSIEFNIPIYIIGLGFVNTTDLKFITKKTNGFFYQTNDPNQLNEIYLNIKDQLKSIYQVDYTSRFNLLDIEEREIKFFFINDTLSFENNSDVYILPKEAIEYIKLKEENRPVENYSSQDNSLLVYGLSISILGMASFLIYYRKKSKKIILDKVHPNPFESILNINYTIETENNHVMLEITSIDGTKVSSLEINIFEKSQEFDLSLIPKGIYLFTLNDGIKQSNSIKVIKV
jgi:Ca-activated chloride channel homolog